MSWKGEKGPEGYQESANENLKRQIAGKFPKGQFDFLEVRFQSILLKYRGIKDKRQGGETMVCEILKTADIAKVVGCPPKELRARTASREWTFAKIRVRGKRRYCETTISDLAKSLGISREEVIRRIEDNGLNRE